MKTFRKNRHNQLDQIWPQRQNALRAGPKSWLLLHRQGQQGQQGIEIGAAGKGGQIHPGDVLLEKTPEQAWLAGTQGQAPVGEKHQHLQMRHLLVLLQQAEGFSAKAAVKTSIGVHLNLQEHYRTPCATAGVLAGPEHAIGVVGHLLEGYRPEDVGGFTFGFGFRLGTGAEVGICRGRVVAVAGPSGGQPGQEMTHQIGHGPEQLGIPVITWQDSGWMGR